MDETQKTFDDEPLWKCKVCGKMFYTTNPAQWTYRRQDKNNHVVWFCGWNCMRTYEKTHPPKPKSAKKW